MAAPMRLEVVRLLCQHLRRLSASQIIPKWNVISQEQTSAQCIGNVAAAAISYHTSSQDYVNIPDLSFEELQKAKSYLNSTDYKEKYQSKPVWANYKRNFKGQVPPEKTRKKCIRGKGEDRKVASNACPICRDENLVVDYQNIELLNQFICPHSWEIYSDSVTGVCQQQQKLIIKAIEKARAHGLILYEVQKIHFNYEDYFKKQANAR